MDAFEVAHEVLGDLPLTTGQTAQLRVIDHKYWQAVFTLLHPDVGDERCADAPEAARLPGAVPALTPEQVADLHAMLVREVRELVRPELRVALGRM